MLIDKKILAGGIIFLVVGFALTSVFSEMTPIGRAGMTDDETERTGELFNSLKGKHSLVVVEHDMDFVAQLKSMVTVLDQGSMLCEGEMAAVQSDPRVIEVYLGR